MNGKLDAPTREVFERRNPHPLFEAGGKGGAGHAGGFRQRRERPRRLRCGVQNRECLDEFRIPEGREEPRRFRRRGFQLATQYVEHHEVNEAGRGKFAAEVGRASFRCDFRHQ